MNSEPPENRDPLTGLLNQRAFRAAIERQLQAQQQDRSSFALLCVDLDGFRRVNDCLGYQVGDKYLCEVPAQFQRCLRPTDSVGRYGGDRFAVLLAGATLQMALACAHSLAESTRESNVVPPELRCTMTIGGVVCRVGDGADANALFWRAAELSFGPKAARFPDGSRVHAEYFRPDAA